MGVVNVTPDSFSDGGLYAEPEAAIAHGLSLAAAGADVVDVGGESTRPGSTPVGVDEELRRVLPVVDALASEGLCVSIDTRKAAVARAAVQAGAQVVNDVSAGTFDPDMLDVMRGARTGVVLMHMRGDPETMQTAPAYDDVVADVAGYLRARAAAARLAGVRRQAIAVDPGIGFGKTLAHNLALLVGLREICDLGYPVVIGTSRKSLFEALVGLGPHERSEATLATTVWSAMAGASVVRVHDVADTTQAALVVDAALRCLRVP